jgi:hypothetical protein
VHALTLLRLGLLRRVFPENLSDAGEIVEVAFEEVKP